MENAPEKANVKLFVDRSEFFEDRVMTIGPHRTAEEQYAFLSFLMAYQNELGHPAQRTHDEFAINAVISQFRSDAENIVAEKRGRRQTPKDTRYLQDAETVLKRAEHLTRYLESRNFHAAVYEAFLLQESYIRMRLRQPLRRVGANDTHESNARAGREKRSSRSKGGTTTQTRAAARIQNMRKRIKMLFQHYLHAGYDPAEIPAKVAKKLKISLATVNRHKPAIE